MTNPFLIRDEAPGDEADIHRVTREAFRSMAYASGTEQHIIDALRKEGVLSVSLIAMMDGQLIGHIGFSPLETSWSASRWYGLGPVSVLPDFQKRGIGGALVRAGLARLRSMGADGCALAGDPAFYGRLGFVKSKTLTIEKVPSDYSLYFSFHDGQAAGLLRFHEAFFRAYPSATPAE